MAEALFTVHVNLDACYLPYLLLFKHDVRVSEGLRSRDDLEGFISPQDFARSAPNFTDHTRFFFYICLYSNIELALAV